MSKQRILHKDELDEILWHYTNDEFNNEDIAEFARFEVPMLVQQIELLHDILWDLKGQVEGLG